MTNVKSESKGTIAICTPMYGGVAHRDYINSVLLISNTLREEGYSVSFHTIGDEDLAPKAKNILVNDALKSKDLVGVLFLDSGVGTSPDDVLSLIDSGKDVIGALVPRKTLNWASVKNAVILKKENLQLYSGAFPVSFIDGASVSISYDEPLEVRHVGSEMLYVSVKALKKLTPMCEKFVAKSADGTVIDGEIVEYFKPSIAGDSKEFLDDDFSFCEMWRSVGGSVWVAPWIDVTNSGVYTFEGSFIHSVDLLANIKELTTQ